MDDFTELQRLLRLKQHETPSEDFFDDFMRDFHYAQRGEMLKRSVWRIALDRLESFWPAVPAGRYAYAGSCAMALVAAGVTSARILSSPAAVASAGNGMGSATAQTTTVAPMIGINAPRPTLGLAELNFDKPRPASYARPASSRPRYVLDSQPVRYEQPFSF